MTSPAPVLLKLPAHPAPDLIRGLLVINPEVKVPDHVRDVRSSDPCA